jgi:hypothetical protein
MSRFRGIDQSAEEARRKQPRRERETERQRGELEGVSEETQERLAFLSDL